MSKSHSIPQADAWRLMRADPVPGCRPRHPVCYDAVYVCDRVLGRAVWQPPDSGRKGYIVGKKSRTKGQALAPVARQPDEVTGLIGFLQQLLTDKRYAEALRAGQTLVENYPLNPLGHAVFGSVLLQLSRPLDALGQFELAVRLGMGGDPMLQHSVAIAASATRYPIHALRAARAGQALGARVTAEQGAAFAAITTSTDAYLAELLGDREISITDAEQALWLDERSTRALASGENDRARELAEEAAETTPGWPLVWNHLSMVLFQLNEIPDAIAACTGPLGDGREEPMLLATLTRLYAVTGHTVEAEAALARLLACPDQGVSAQEEIAKGLGILYRDREIYERLAPLGIGEGSTLHPVGRYLLGVAAANLGQSDDARLAWKNLWREGLPQVRLFGEIIGRGEQPPIAGGKYPYYAAAELVPATILDELATEVQPARDDTRLLQIAADFPLLPQALCETFYATGLDPRLAVDLLVRLPDPAAVEAIRTYATSRASGDHNRVFAHVALRGAGQEDPATPASVWISGRRRELTLPAIRTSLPQPPTYSEEIGALMQEAAALQGQDDATGATEVYRRALAIDDSVAEVEHNLGTALLLSGSLGEGEDHLRRALEMDDAYVLARCNLASLAQMRGDLGAAHELLDPLEGRIDYTLEEAVSYLRTRADLARADGDLARAEGLLQALLGFDPENALARERLDALAAGAMASVG